MAATINKLAEERSAALDDVRDLFSSANGQIQAATYCGADFFARRLQQNRRHSPRLRSQSHCRRDLPVFATTSPAERVDAGKDKTVTYYGYDFLAFKESAGFTAVLKYADGEIADAAFGHVMVGTDYQLSVEFQNYDFSRIQRDRGPQILLTWSSKQVGTDVAGVQSALPIIIPKRVESHEDFVVTAHFG